MLSRELEAGEVEPVALALVETDNGRPEGVFEGGEIGHGLDFEIGVEVLVSHPGLRAGLLVEVLAQPPDDLLVDRARIGEASEKRERLPCQLRCRPWAIGTEELEGSGGQGRAAAEAVVAHRCEVHLGDCAKCIGRGNMAPLLCQYGRGEAQRFRCFGRTNYVDCRIEPLREAAKARDRRLRIRAPERECFLELG